MAERENWKPVPGFEGYEVSDLGRVRSVDRMIPWRGARAARKGRMLKLADGTDGMLYVDLGRLWRRAGVHQLVMLAFVGPPPAGLEVCHNNGKPKENVLSNLRYDTRRENQMDRVKHGTSNRGLRSGRAKLTPAAVREIRQGGNAIALAAKFGINRGYVYRLRSGECWGWLDADDGKNT